MARGAVAVRHLYVHIPFCRARCAYCDFASEALASDGAAGRVARYVAALRTELAGLMLPDTPGSPAPLRAGTLDTIYMGGGTPTVLPRPVLVSLAAELGRLLTHAPAAGPPEFTVEANPGTIDGELLCDLAGAGVSRLSLGVQSFDPSLRAALGRRVSQEEIEGALMAIHECGWNEWSIDLVFGIPGQDWRAALGDLESAVVARPTHISVYDLTYTLQFDAWVARTLGAGAQAAAGRFAEDHYERIAVHLEEAGYRRYEVSNFALPGHECRHNQAYWLGADYLGLGASAVSTTADQRLTNPRCVDGYLAGEAPEIEMLSPGIKQWERAMLGLRTRLGVDESTVVGTIDLEQRDRLLVGGFLERDCGRLRINPGFLDISNTIISALLVSTAEIKM